MNNRNQLTKTDKLVGITAFIFILIIICKGNMGNNFFTFFIAIIGVLGAFGSALFGGKFALKAVEKAQNLNINQKEKEENEKLQLVEKNFIKFWQQVFLKDIYIQNEYLLDLQIKITSGQTIYPEFVPPLFVEKGVLDTFEVTDIMKICSKKNIHFQRFIEVTQQYSTISLNSASVISKRYITEFNNLESRFFLITLFEEITLKNSKKDRLKEQYVNEIDFLLKRSNEFYHNAVVLMNDLKKVRTLDDLQ